MGRWQLVPRRWTCNRKVRQVDAENAWNVPEIRFNACRAACPRSNKSPIGVLLSPCPSGLDEPSEILVVS
jgi:hypothetical protein